VSYLVILLLAAQLSGPVAHFHKHGGIALPDPSETPGVIRTTNAAKVCSETTTQYRHTTASTKKHVCMEYGLEPHCWGPEKAEIDHLLPLELGGLDNIQDLWPQPAPSYHWKDKLENFLKHEVCVTKKLELAAAQKCIMDDWVACYEKEIGPLPKN
jgi:hypothetical protein